MKASALRRLLAVALLLGSSITAGCRTYRATPDTAMSESEAIHSINKLLNQARAFSTWKDSLAGTSAFIEPALDNRGVRRKYAEIESVEVEANFGMLIAFGLWDPTLVSKVILNYKDTTSTEIRRDPYGTYWAWPPFYFFRPSWYEVDQAAKGFELMRVKHAVSPKTITGP